VIGPIGLVKRIILHSWNCGIILVEMNDKKIVLVVGMGTSPAVMTETVWALAHRERQVTGTY
jgi:hypothetical protein